MSDSEGTVLLHVQAALAVLDARVRACVALARASAVEPDPMGGYYVSEAEVDRLLAEATAVPVAPVDPAAAERERLAALTAGEAAGTPSRLAGLAPRFGLTAADLEIVLTCLGPEVEPRFGRLFGYLHDDLTRRRPTVGLVLDLWAPDPAGRLARLARLDPDAPLVRHRLVLAEPDATPASFLECGLRLDPRLTRHLLGSDTPDPHLLQLLLAPPRPSRSGRNTLTATGVSVSSPSTPRGEPGPLRPDGPAGEVLRWLDRTEGEGVVHLGGPEGAGRTATAREVARRLGRPLLVVRSERLRSLTASAAADAVALVAREARLRDAVTFWRDADALTTSGVPPPGPGTPAALDAASFLDALAEVPGPVLLGGSGPWTAVPPRDRPFLRLDLGRPDARTRLDLWRHRTAFGAPTPDPADPPDVAALAGAFRFTPGQIRDAVAAAGERARLRDPAAPRLRMGDLTDAARERSGRGMRGPARHVVTGYGWEDLVLPDPEREQLQDLAGQVRHRALVHDTWGFGRVAGGGGGITVLFTGPPGTGKTMAASVLANDLGVDLLTVDLATTVSKYLGETEQNLARVFEAAADGNAVLFFDEADALFGRRTQVRDAHDRYANLETSYLLQRLEEHPGVVVLATNLRKNLDEAFVRRFRATIAFPLPQEPQRRRIWERIWPDAAPRGEDVDLDLLARRIDLPGGHLRNIVLEAAFRAAADGGVITMAHLLAAAGREYGKLGSVVPFETPVRRPADAAETFAR